MGILFTIGPGCSPATLRRLMEDADEAIDMAKKKSKKKKPAKSSKSSKSKKSSKKKPAKKKNPAKKKPAKKAAKKKPAKKPAKKKKAKKKKPAKKKNPTKSKAITAAQRIAAMNRKLATLTGSDRTAFLKAGMAGNVAVRKSSDGTLVAYIATGRAATRKNPSSKTWAQKAGVKTGSVGPIKGLSAPAMVKRFTAGKSPAQAVVAIGFLLNVSKSLDASTRRNLKTARAELERKRDADRAKIKPSAKSKPAKKKAKAKSAPAKKKNPPATSKSSKSGASQRLVKTEKLKDVASEFGFSKTRTTIKGLWNPQGAGAGTIHDVGDVVNVTYIAQRNGRLARWSHDFAKPIPAVTTSAGFDKLTEKAPKLLNGRKNKPARIKRKTLARRWVKLGDVYSVRLQKPGTNERKTHTFPTGRRPMLLTDETRRELVITYTGEPRAGVPIYATGEAPSGSVAVTDRGVVL